MKRTALYLVLLNISFLTSCTPLVHHADPFYNFSNNDWPLLHLPLIKPSEAKRQDGRTPWRVFLPCGPWVSVPNSQEEYGYDVEELQRFAVKDGVILAYSAYVDRQADAYIQDNCYHWFVLIPDKHVAEGFHAEDEFSQCIQTLGVQDPDWQTPDAAYEQFARTGCLERVPECNRH